jgi:CO/xanthine dehydrogenase FAD-binding subunit
MSESVVIAGSVQEAVEQLATGARAVAGGTDLVVGARQGKAPLPKRLVAIHQLSALGELDQTGDSLQIGALVSHSRLAELPLVHERLTALADACAIVGSHATRAQGTLGGNLMNASPAMETGGPLMCFDAKVTLRSPGGTRELAVDDLLAGPGQTTAGPDELLERVDVPLPAVGTGSCYLRLEYRRQMEIAVVGATAVLALESGEITKARIAITALAPTIRRVPEAEAALNGTDGGAEALRGAATAIEAACLPISDVRASAAYRSAMAAVIGRRAIEAALVRARGTEVPVPASPALHGGL